MVEPLTGDDQETSRGLSGDPLVGTRLGTYKIQAFVGAGGMGAVYLGEDEALRRKAAIKVLSLLSPPAKLRFVNEARNQARLDHQNIVSVYGAGSALIRGMEVHYIALKYIDGRSLTALVREHGPFDALQATELMLDAARGLNYVHSEGFIHRDVKPSNILVDLSERALISDFGVARDQSDSTEVVSGGEFLGTLNYASPEQIARQQVDVRTDIFSLGLTYLYALTGVEPHPGDSKEPYSTDGRFVIDPALPPLVHSALERMLAPSRENRMPSMLACIDALEAALEGLRPSESALRAAPDPTPAIRREAPPEDDMESGLGGRVITFVLLAAVGLGGIYALATRPPSSDPGTQTAPVVVVSAEPAAPPAPDEEPAPAVVTPPPDSGSVSEPQVSLYLPSVGDAKVEVERRLVAAEAVLLAEEPTLTVDIELPVEVATAVDGLEGYLTGDLAELERKSEARGDRLALTALDDLWVEIAPRVAALHDRLVYRSEYGLLVDRRTVTNAQYFAFLLHLANEGESSATLSSLAVMDELVDDAWVAFQEPRDIRRPHLDDISRPLLGMNMASVEKYESHCGKRVPTKDEWSAAVEPYLEHLDVTSDPMERVEWDGEAYFAGVVEEATVFLKALNVNKAQQSLRLVRWTGPPAGEIPR